MIVAIAADHAGFALKQKIIPDLRSHGHEVKDLGTNSPEPVDYPDVAGWVAGAVLSGAVERGVLICGSGVGASVAANKFPGIRAGLCHDTYSAHQGVEHDNMNVLALGAHIIGDELAKELVRAFVAAKFDGNERFQRRLNKVIDIENNKQ
jgi:ribose 5-phosphate isomerase B